MLTKQDVINASSRINKFIKKTPLIKFSELCDITSNNIYLKLDNEQVTNSFKIRGVINLIQAYQESHNKMPIIHSFSSGNHAIALAWAAREFNIEVKLYLNEGCNPHKLNKIKELGVTPLVFNTRIRAEQTAYKDAKKSGGLFLPPSDNDMLIAGAGTLALESLEQANEKIDAIFASIGGGALVSGALLASDGQASVYGVEPEIANDASRSFQSGKICGYKESPATIADGTRTLKISERTFQYIKQLRDIIEVPESMIHHWTIWLYKNLDLKIEPSSALALAGAVIWSKQHTEKNLIVLISGGNVEPSFFDV